VRLIFLYLCRSDDVRRDRRSLQVREGHVVNTQTGERVSYQAEQQDIKSDSFKTLKGKTVYVADIECIETEEE